MNQTYLKITLAFCLIISLQASCQKVLKEFNGRLTNFMTVPLGDSVLFGF